MFSDATNHSHDGSKSSLNVEWHDCAWRPAINLRATLAPRRGAATKPLPAPALLPHSVRRQNLFKPMKNKNISPRTRRAAFTLVELLTVIAIIGILAAMLLPVLIAVKKKAQAMKAKTEIAELVNAINAYDTDYGRFPTSSRPAPNDAQDAATVAKGDFTYGGPLRALDGTVTLIQNPATYTYQATNSEVIAILMDITNTPSGAATINNGHLKNPKQTHYLNAKFSGDTSSPGVGTDLVYRDPWGNPYIITMDLNYDEVCWDAFYKSTTVSAGGLNGLISQTDSGGNPVYAYRGKVMVWSAGPDGKVDSTAAANTGFNKDNVLSW